MKKASRDYRRNQRKKWIRINTLKINLLSKVITGTQSIAIIQSIPGISEKERSLKIVSQVMHTANLLINILR